MCGGAGTRLWPSSREGRPKQFLPLFGPRSTFQDTLLRVSDAALFDRPIVITSATYRFMVREQLDDIGLEADVLLEPMRRDSGPAIAAGAAFAQTRDAEAVVLALAADHVVNDTAAFVAACRQGLFGDRCRQDRDVRRQAGTAGNGIRLHLAGQGHCRRRARGGEIRREARSADRGGLYRCGLSLEQRQLHVPRRDADGRIQPRRCRQRAGHSRGRRRGRPRSRLHHASMRIRSAGRSRSRSTMR